MIPNSALTMLSVSTPRSSQPARAWGKRSAGSGKSGRRDGLPLAFNHAGGHSCVTQFRNQEDTGGLERTRRARRLSTGAHARNRQDTEGYTVVPVRDREAPGSNPGPPTKNRIQIEVFAWYAWCARVTGRSQIFLEPGGGSPVQVDFKPSIELAHGHRKADI